MLVRLGRFILCACLALLLAACGSATSQAPGSIETEVAARVIGTLAASTPTALPSATPIPEPLPCSKQALDFVREGQKLYDEWKDAAELASSTGRIALAPVVSELQDIRRRWLDLRPPACAELAHKQMTAYMESLIGAYMRFMAEDPMAALHMDLAEIDLRTALRLYEIAGLVPPAPVPTEIPATPTPDASATPSPSPTPELSSLIPPAGVYKHDRKITVEYDKFKDQTVVEFPPDILNTGQLIVGDVSALFTYPGRNASIPSGVMVSRWKLSSEWQYLKCHDIVFMADRKRIEPLEVSHDGEVLSSGTLGLPGVYVSERVNAWLSAKQFLQLVNADTVEVQVCRDEFFILANQMEGLRDLASYMSPASEEGTTLRASKPTNTPTPTTIITFTNAKANLRSGPGTEYPIVASVGWIELLVVKGKNAEPATWWFVEDMTGKNEGWISKSLVDTVDGKQIPIVASGPTPPPPPKASRPPAAAAPSQPKGQLVADSSADYPGGPERNNWYYLWSDGRNSFNWQPMSQPSPNDCYRDAGPRVLEICRDSIKTHPSGDVALQWKANRGGTYRFEWDSSELKFYKHANLVGSKERGATLRYAATIQNVIDWEMFFWVAKADTQYRVLVYRLD